MLSRPFKKLLKVAVLLVGFGLLFAGAWFAQAAEEETDIPVVETVTVADLPETVEGDEPNWFTAWLAKKRAQWVTDASDVIQQQSVALDAERVAFTKTLQEFDEKRKDFGLREVHMELMRQALEKKLLLFDACILKARAGEFSEVLD